MKAQDFFENIRHCNKDRASFPMYANVYNRFDLFSDENTHWICRSPKNPSFGFNKFFCRKTSSGFELGVHIEKGYELKGAASKSNQLMGQEWDWNQTMKRMDQGEMDLLMKQLAKTIDQPVFFRLTSHYKDGKLTKEINGNMKADGSYDCMMIPGLDALSQFFTKDSNFQWQWVNLYIYTLLDKAAVPMSDSKEELVSIYDDRLRPFQTWVE